jgi:hypothetical protein
MSIPLNKVASALAFIIGAMAIVAGGQVLIGRDPGYYVINWLPLYNYSIGLLTVFITTVLLWTNHRLGLPVAILTLSLHVLIMFILQIAYREVVAIDSIVAMIIRMTTWFVILALMLLQARKRAFQREYHVN